MGFFKDMRSVMQTANAMTPPEHRGLTGSMRLAKDGMAQMSGALGDMAAESQKAQHLMVSGRVGTATVNALRDTGMSINDNPVVELDLEVIVDGGVPYGVTHRQTISRLAVAGFQPGSSVPVRVDPMDPQSLIVA